MRPPRCYLPDACGLCQARRRDYREAAEEDARRLRRRSPWSARDGRSRPRGRQR